MGSARDKLDVRIAVWCVSAAIVLWAVSMLFMKRR